MLMHSFGLNFPRNEAGYQETTYSLDEWGVDRKQGYIVINKFMLAIVVSYRTHSSVTNLKKQDLLIRPCLHSTADRRYGASPIHQYTLSNCSTSTFSQQNDDKYYYHSIFPFTNII